MILPGNNAALGPARAVVGVVGQIDEPRWGGHNNVWHLAWGRLAGGRVYGDHQGLPGRGICEAAGCCYDLITKGCIGAQDQSSRNDGLIWPAGQAQEILTGSHMAAGLWDSKGLRGEQSKRECVASAKCEV